ncbi:MAG: ribosomal protein S18-alanine N-acetyltransferase [Chloroflexota bacterium]|nr:ribosomal protein S18-alanine N-acetyltransferase [Chloroflexota bacterium]
MAVAVPVIVEPMRLADVAAVHEIERLSFATPWPAYAFEQELTSNRLARYVVARAGPRVVGFGGLWLMVDEAHITTFGVHPGWRRRGVGRRMLVALFDLAWELRAARMTLEVRIGNTAAQALYAELGFEVAGRRVAYYSDDGEDALVMTTPALASIRVQQLVAEARRRVAKEAG